MSHTRCASYRASPPSASALIFARSPPIASATAYMSRLEMEFPMKSTVCPRMTCRASLGVILWNPQALLGCLGMRREYASA